MQTKRRLNEYAEATVPTDEWTEVVDLKARAGYPIKINELNAGFTVNIAADTRYFVRVLLNGMVRHTEELSAGEAGKINFPYDLWGVDVISLEVRHADPADKTMYANIFYEYL